jgi:hypothetical protein
MPRERSSAIWIPNFAESIPPTESAQALPPALRRTGAAPARVNISSPELDRGLDLTELERPARSCNYERAMRFGRISGSQRKAPRR